MLRILFWAPACPHTMKLFISPHHSHEIMYQQQKAGQEPEKMTMCIHVCVCVCVRVGEDMRVWVHCICVWCCTCNLQCFHCQSVVSSLPPLLPFSIPPPPPLCLLIQQWVAEVYCSVWWMWNSSLMEWISHSELVHIACTYSYIIMPLLEA